MLEFLKDVHYFIIKKIIRLIDKLSAISSTIFYDSRMYFIFYLHNMKKSKKQIYKEEKRNKEFLDMFK